MAKYLLDKLFAMRLMRAFRINTTPRWVILLLDMLIVVVSFGIITASSNYIVGHQSLGALNV